MGYRLKLLPYKTRAWKVQYQTRKGGVRKDVDIRETDYLRLGLNSDMGVEEVRKRVQQLNAQEALKRIEEKRSNITKRLHHEDTSLNAFLPEHLRLEFENLFIVSTKEIVHWRTVKRLLLKLKMDIGDYEFQKARWYSKFASCEYGYSYVQKLIFMLNRWGKFVAYRQKSFFEPLSYPTGIDKQRIIDVHDNLGVTKESCPLTPAHLEGLKERLREDHWNWLYLSVWFGLRPGEVDSLLKPPGPKTWSLVDNCLWVYQSKLTGIANKERLKPIPLKYQEQKDAILIVESKKFKRPLNKTLKLHLNSQTTCYGGRKGFTDLMLGLGNSLEAISQWMGHKSLDRTWKYYKDKKNVLL